MRGRKNVDRSFNFLFNNLSSLQNTKWIFGGKGKMKKILWGKRCIKCGKWANPLYPVRPLCNNCWKKEGSTKESINKEWGDLKKKIKENG